MNSRLVQMIERGRLPIRDGHGHIPMVTERTNKPINNNNMEQQEEPKIGAIRTRSYCGKPAKLEEGSSEHSNALTTAIKDNVVVENPKFRIRKLSPRECFRLMDVDDADIDKIQAAGISKSRQYCLAGNSIAVACLYHIFRKMFIETENESQQLTLF